MKNNYNWNELVGRANEAFLEYRKTNVEVKRNLLFSLSKKLEENFSDMVELIILEAKKPKGYAENEVMRSIQLLKHFAEEIIRFESGETLNIGFGNGIGKWGIKKNFPVGIVLGISPYNFPLNLAMHKIAPCIALGNSCIIKPSPHTPKTMLKFKAIFDEVSSEVNKDIFQVYLAHNNQEIANAVMDERVQILSFTGSSEVGFYLKKIAGAKKVFLELGGNAAVIVTPNTNLKKCAEEIARGAYLYAGQVCISVQRIIVHESVQDEFLNYFIDYVKNNDVLNSPLITKMHLEKIKEKIDDAVAMGAEIILGGETENINENIFKPTLLKNVNRSCKLYAEEIFGPVAMVECYTGDIKNAIDAVNESIFGLQAGVYTDSLSDIKTAFEFLDVGAVIIGNVPGFRHDVMPYGGIKKSGIGREGVLSTLVDFSEEKVLIY